ncbi:hypothetical protein F2Q69_00006021 [Brassica cretica]|uniref:Uncharacterized protein n=1 Tax=Brassica cretica TaxID=69181 RepID=A0A8S9NUH3_BRACR|nr:hypothetical protein F2Q69_00006021 [Brassica cretica]
MDTLQLVQTFSISVLSIDNEAVTSINRYVLISIDNAVYISIDPRDRGGSTCQLTTLAKEPKLTSITKLDTTACLGGLKAKARKRRLSYTPLPRLARAALSANGLSSTSSTSAEVMPNRDLLVDAHRRLIGEVFLLRSKVQDMIARRDLLVQQVKASTRWELMKEWLEKRVEHWNPEEEYRRHLFLSGGINHQSGGFSQAATLRSVIGSRFSEEPSF